MSRCFIIHSFFYFYQKKIIRFTWENIIVLLAVIWYLLTAFFSVGYFHADEHYQIIEFAGILDGSSDPNALPWEYKAKLRSTIQPVICSGIFQVCDALSISDRFDKATALRIITALLSLFCIYFFTNSCRRIVQPRYWLTFLFLSYFLWFLPFINVRFSSETWSGLCLLVAVGLILREKRNAKTYVYIGLLLGFGFLCRNQIAFAAIGIVAWLIIIRKENFGKLSAMIGAGLLMVLIGIGVDSWFYGSPTLTLWNYFNVNILEGKASEFGEKPAFYYIYYLFRFTFFPFGICIISSIIFLLNKKSRNIIIWTIIPFILLHSVIAHKELRFLFPLVNFAAIAIVLSFQEIKIGRSKLALNVGRKVVLGLIMMNIVGVVVASLKPAGIGRVKIAERIHEDYSVQERVLYQFNNSNPLSPWHLTANFYKDDNIQFKSLQGVWGSSAILPKGNLLVINAKDQSNENVKQFIVNQGFDEIERSIPSWMLTILDIYSYPEGDILVLYAN